MPAVSLSPGVFGAGYQSFLSTGLPNNAGLLYTYQAGTTTPIATYTTIAGTVANANPIVLGADGRPPQEIWIDNSLSYKFELRDALNNVISTFDNLTPAGLAVTAGPVSGVALTTATFTTITSLVLTTGDWDVSGVLQLVPAGTTVPQVVVAGINTTPAAAGAVGTFTQMGATFTTGASQIVNTPVTRVTVTGTQTVYLIGYCQFTTSTCTAGGTILARRRS